MVAMAPQNGGASPSPTAAGPVRNPLGDHLMGRVARLSPQEKQVLAEGITPQAAQVIRKVLPELAPLIDQVFGGGGGGMPGGQAQPPAGRTLLSTV